MAKLDSVGANGSRVNGDGSPGPSPAVGKTLPSLSAAQAAELNRRFHLAAEHGDIKWARELLAEGANPRSCDEKGQTALMRAAMNDHVIIMELLIDECRVPVDEKDELGRTALMDAAAKGRFDSVVYLVSRGANPNNLDNDLRNSLMHACMGESTDMHVRVHDLVGFLLSYIHNVNQVDRYGNTALDLAKDAHNEDVSVLLGKSGALEKDARLAQTR